MKTYHESTQAVAGDDGVPVGNMTKPPGRIRSGWPHYLGLVAILILGGGFRFSGLSHGWSDYSLHEEQAPRAGGTFYRFHPDETTLVEAARQLTDSLHPPTTAYGAVPQYLLRLATWVIYPAALNTRCPCRRQTNIRCSFWPDSSLLSPRGWSFRWSI